MTVTGSRAPSRNLSITKSSRRLFPGSWLSIEECSMNRMPTIPEPPAKRRRRAVPELRDLHAHKEQRPMMAELYRRAEARLRDQRGGPRSSARDRQTEAETER